MKNKVKIKDSQPYVTNRRNFIKLSGLGVVSAGLLLSGCDNDDDDPINTGNQYPGMRNGVFDFGNGDLGVLSYAYALEQLAADFYIQVVNDSAFSTTFNAQEQ